MTNNKGITLIALVITIIVLLILAGVSIAMLTGQNGILTQANSSKSTTAKAEAVEKINLALNAMKSEIYSQQVTNSSYAPATNATTADAAMITVLKKDFPTISTSEKDGDYWYTVTGSVITLHYKNSAQKVSEVTGTLMLTSPYTITEAK